MHHVHSCRGVLAVLLLAACPRATTPPPLSSGDHADPPTPITILDVQLLPPRPQGAALEADSGTTLRGFAGDTLVVRGSGWDPVVANVQVDGVNVPLEVRTDIELQGVLPLLPVGGHVKVSSGERSSGPSVEVVRTWGPGHPGSPAFLGRVEPLLTINASGVAGVPCHGGPVDGGTSLGLAAYCADMRANRFDLGVAFSLGALQTYGDPQLLSRVDPVAGTAEVGVLPGQDGGVVARLMYGAVPYTRPEDDPLALDSWFPALGSMEGLITEGTPRGYAARLWNKDQLLDTTRSEDAANRFLSAALLRLGNGWLHPVLEFNPREPQVWGHGLYRTVPGAGLPQDTLLAFVRGVSPVAVGLLPSDWWSLRPEAVPPGVVLLDVAQVPGQREVHVVALLFRSPADTAPLALCNTPPCQDPLTGEVQPLATLDTSLCDHDLECLACLELLADSAFSGNRLPLAVAPWQQDEVLLLPTDAFSPLDSAAAPLCRFSLADKSFHQEPPGLGLRVTAAAVVRGRGGDTAEGSATAPGEPTLVMVPATATPRAELWLYSESGGLGYVRTRTPYRDVRVAPNGSVVYALPATGGRVDVLDNLGNLFRSASVLGTPMDAWPVSGRSEVLAVYPSNLVHMDTAGGIRAQLSHATWCPVSWDVPPGQEVQGLWSSVPAAQGWGVAAARLDVSPQGVFGEVQERVDIPGSPLCVQVLGRAANRLVYQAWGYAFPGSGHPCVGYQGSARGGAAPSADYATSWVASMPLSALTGGDATATLHACDTYYGAVDGADGTLFLVGPWQDPVAGSVQVMLAAVDLVHPEGAPVADAVLETLESAGPERQPVAWVGYPPGGMLGVFFNAGTFAFELDRVELESGALHFDSLGSVPFATAALALSPDGRRLYAGEPGRITSYRMVHSDAGVLAGVEVEQLIPVEGNPALLRMDATGTRLVYVDQDSQMVGLVE